MENNYTIYNRKSGEIEYEYKISLDDNSQQYSVCTKDYIPISVLSKKDPLNPLDNIKLNMLFSEYFTVTIKAKIITNEDMKQGEDEWKWFRLGKATASNFSSIITRGGKRSISYIKYARQIAFENFVTQIPETFNSEAMRRGSDLETIAREEYSQLTLNEVKEVAFFDCGDYGFSPDGLVGDDGLIEIKAMNIEKHGECFVTKEIPDCHYAQCQGALMISERKWLDFVSYNPDLQKGLDIVVIRVFPDMQFINCLKDYLQDTINERDACIKTFKDANAKYCL